jgi:2-dehydropantoate 2-reductase
MDVAAAAASAKTLLAESAVLLSIQNGLGGPDTAAAVVGRAPVLVGVVGGFGASVTAPGHVHHNGMEFVRLGELDGPITPRLERVAEVWRGAGFRVQLFDDIHQLVWEKLICNCAFSGPCGVSERTIGEAIGDPGLWRISAACASEAYEVARAKGVTIGFGDPVAHVRAFGLKIPNARPSILLDLLAGRRSEIGVINGAIPRVGGEVGLSAPVNETITALIRSKERRLP